MTGQIAVEINEQGWWTLLKEYSMYNKIRTVKNEWNVELNFPTLARFIKKFYSIKNNESKSAVQLNSGSVNSEILLIQTGDDGPCWAHCIYTG